MQTKTCQKCKLDLPPTREFFNRDKRKKDGLDSRCRKCNKAHCREWYYKNRQLKPYKPPKIYERGEPKTCTKCGDTFPATREFFYQDQSQVCGWHPWCKTCSTTKTKQWVQKNKDRMRAYKRQWYKENQEHVISLKWHRRRKTNCHIVYKFNRKARLAHAGEFSTQEWDVILDHYSPDGHCLCCGHKRPLTVDHVIPLSSGGSNTVDNLQPICASCNSIKHTQKIDYRPDKGEFARVLIDT